MRDFSTGLNLSTYQIFYQNTNPQKSGFVTKNKMIDFVDYSFVYVDIKMRKKVI